MEILAPSNASLEAIELPWTQQGDVAKACRENAGDIGELVGTAFVARDMMQIVDALDEDGLLRYWGISYVTILGMTVAAMFPDRIDRTMLDGVVNPHDWYSGQPVEAYVNTDDVFWGFLRQCLQAGEACALAKLNSSPEELYQRIYELSESLKDTPLHIAGETLLYSHFFHLIERSVYAPGMWSFVAEMLYGIIESDMTVLQKVQDLGDSAGRMFPQLGSIEEANAAIKCGESSLRANITSSQPLLQRIAYSSWMLGGRMAVREMTCLQWNMTARERYTGGFTDLKTNNPILFVGNLYDPVTPLVSAKNASAGFKDSVVLQHNGYGHSSWAQHSSCTANVIRAYFETGALPAPNTQCEV